MATLNPALKPFWKERARNRVLYGGRGSSKSWDAAGVAIARASYIKTRFLCVRALQNKIEESVYALLKIQIERFGLTNQFTILNNKIIHKTTGSEFLFYGLWRHIGEIKSIESVDVLWSEESHLLSKEQWEILEPTIRKEGSECWFIFNPRLSTDFVWKRFVVNPPPNTVVRKINYDENPFLSSTMLEIIEAAKNENIDDFNHIYLGEPKDDNEDAVIKRSHVLAAIDAHKKLGIEITGAHRIGFDVADDGEDACAMVQTHGNLIHWADLWKGREDELLKSCTRVWRRAVDTGCQVTYDAIGVGATVGAKFKEMPEHVRAFKFFAGGSVNSPNLVYNKTGIKNKDYFANIKSQAWWVLADKFRNTYNAIHDGQKFNDSDMIFIDSATPHLEQMIDELCTPKRTFDNAGRVMVEQKKDLKKRDVPSPNLADAVIMATLNMQKAGSF